MSANLFTSILQLVYDEQATEHRVVYTPALVWQLVTLSHVPNVPRCSDICDSRVIYKEVHRNKWRQLGKSSCRALARLQAEGTSGRARGSHQIVERCDARHLRTIPSFKLGAHDLGFCVKGFGWQARCSVV